ncbi:MAG: hypothetical protein U1E59_15980 [Amaricoccus sp.]
MPTTPHEIYPYTPPEALAEGVWLVRGNLPYPLHRNMVIVRLATGELVLHSVVAMEETGLRALEALGTPAYAIVPSILHVMDAPFYKQRYPAMKQLAPSASMEEIGRTVALDGSVEDVLPPLGFKLHAVPGTKMVEFVYDCPLPGGGRALIVNDAFGSAHAADDTRVLGRLIVSHIAVPGHHLGIPRIYRWRFITDIAAVRRFAGDLAAIPDLRLVTVSHGDPVIASPADALRSLAAG